MASSTNRKSCHTTRLFLMVVIFRDFSINSAVSRDTPSDPNKSALIPKNRDIYKSPSQIQKSIQTYRNDPEFLNHRSHTKKKGIHPEMRVYIPKYL
jgi:hypothetical protein